MEQTILTEDGFKKLKDLYVQLKSVKRPQIIEEMKNAQEGNNCDISENNEYLEACAELNRVENKMSELEEKLSRARIVRQEDVIDDGKVRFGCTVKLLRLDDEKEMEFKIVGIEESDIKGGKLSFAAPLTKEMMKLEEEDEFDYNETEYRILSICVNK